MAKLWGGRFQKSTDRRVDDFNSSIRFDKRMYAQDIRGSIAHANMLGRQGIIPQADAEKIVEGLRGILDDINAGKVEFLIDAEDIHMNVEKLLTDRIGEAGKRQLSSARRHLLTPALLGRAVPRILQGRNATDGSRGVSAARTARNRDI